MDFETSSVGTVVWVVDSLVSMRLGMAAVERKRYVWVRVAVGIEAMLDLVVVIVIVRGSPSSEDA